MTGSTPRASWSCREPGARAASEVRLNIPGPSSSAGCWQPCFWLAGACYGSLEFRQMERNYLLAAVPGNLWPLLPASRFHYERERRERESRYDTIQARRSKCTCRMTQTAAAAGAGCTAPAQWKLSQTKPRQKHRLAERIRRGGAGAGAPRRALRCRDGIGAHADPALAPPGPARRTVPRCLPLPAGRPPEACVAPSPVGHPCPCSDLDDKHRGTGATSARVTTARRERRRGDRAMSMMLRSRVACVRAWTDPSEYSIGRRRHLPGDVTKDT